MMNINHMAVSLEYLKNIDFDINALGIDNEVEIHNKQWRFLGVNTKVDGYYMFQEIRPKQKRKLIAVDPDGWKIKKDIPMEICDKSESIVTTVNGDHLKCTNKEDEKLVIAMLRQQPMSTLAMESE